MERLRGQLPKGVTNAAGKMFLARLATERVILKRAGSAQAAVVQCAVDELKPLWELPKMGTHRASYGSEPARWLVLRYHDNLGDFVDEDRLFGSETIVRELLKVLAFEAAVQTGDRTLGNLLLLPGDRVLPIDEMRAFLFTRPPVLRFRKTAQAPLQLLYGDRWWAAYVSRVRTAGTLPAIAAVLRRFGLETHSLSIARRVERTHTLVGQMLYGRQLKEGRDDG